MIGFYALDFTFFICVNPGLQESQLLQNSQMNSRKILEENAFLESNSCKNLTGFAFSWQNVTENA